MYNPPHFRIEDLREMQRFIAAHPLATLFSHTAYGPDAAHLPLLWQDDGSANGILYGHFAKANPMWRSARHQPHGSWLAVFHHPGHYISPNWYPSKARDHKAVPTWNYQSVHAHGTLRLIDTQAETLEILSRLTEQHESSQTHPWRMSDAPEKWLHGMSRAVVCFAFVIRCLEGKFKLSQNHPQDNRRGVIAGLLGEDNADAAHLAAQMQAAETARNDAP